MTSTLVRPAALGSLAIIILCIAGAPARCDDLIDTVPFSLIGSPAQQTVYLPQFDPAHGTLDSATITVTGSMQFVLEVFDSGPGGVSVTAHDTLSFNGTPLQVEGTFTSTIPASQSPYTFGPIALSLGNLTESLGPNVVSFFTGTGTLPYQFSLPRATIDAFSGPTTSGALAFTGASGNVTADYAFTPAPVPVPEPSTLGLAGLALIGLTLAPYRSQHLEAT